MIEFEDREELPFSRGSIVIMATTALLVGLATIVGVVQLADTVGRVVAGLF